MKYTHSEQAFVAHVVRVAEFNVGRDEFPGDAADAGLHEEEHEGGTAGAQGRRRGHGPGRQATGAFGNDAAECAAQYCQGQGREGRRTTQVRVRRRWVDAVRAALEATGGRVRTFSVPSAKVSALRLINQRRSDCAPRWVATSRAL